MKSGLNEKWIVCRVCLKQPKEVMQTIFDDKGPDLTKMIFECGGVPIKKYDHYPDKICSKCLKCLHMAYKFRITCQRSHNHLSRFIAPVEVGADEHEIEQIRDDNDNSSDIMTDLNEEVEIISDEAENIALKLEPNDLDDLDIKEELTNVDDEILEEDDFGGMDPDVVDVFEPMEDDELDEIQAIDQDGMNDEIEYLDDIPAENPPTSDEEFLPNNRVPKAKQLKKLTKTVGIKAGKGRVGRPPGRTNSGIRTEKKDTKSKRSKEKYFICDVCGNIYPTQGRLTEHLKLHQGIKPHECEICGHAFAQTQQLARHMNTHTGNRPYKCNYCPAAFADLSTRNKHHRIHTNERPYVCDVCGKSFSYTNTLKFHKMTHTGEKPFVCDLCGKGFQQAYKLRNHKQTHEKRGMKIQKIDPDALHTFQEASVAASQILEI